jgi:hypothetical protein
MSYLIFNHSLLSSTNSYNGQKAFFIDKNVLIYSCGNSIKFYNTENKSLSSFQPSLNTTNSEANTIGLLTANASNNVFAFSDTDMPPNVHVYENGSKIQQLSRLESNRVSRFDLK